MERVSGERTYGQYCPVAAGLDLIGDRWVLLICRELLDSPRGFNEIKRALPGLASNLLTTRLRTMTADGLVARDELGYRLTDDGRAVAPILRAVARFGVGALSGMTPEPLNALRVARGLLLPWIAAGRMPALVVVRVSDDSAADIVTEDGGVRLRERAPDEPPVDPTVVVLRVDPQNLADVRGKGAQFTGSAEGPEPARTRVLEALALT